MRESGRLREAIARASREQASAIEEVSVAVRQMDEMTQHNAALVEETDAAIEQTEGQANELDRIVDVFVVTDRGSAKPANSRVETPQPARRISSKLQSTAGTYLTQGNAAVKQDWAEF